ncbi:hypothetical protein OROGR_011455 [Orobanche gracilis]
MTRRWTQEEYDEIRKYREEHGNEWKVLAEEFDRHRVHAKLSEEKRSKHGMLRDNICWTVISDKLSIRSQTNCCIKCFGFKWFAYWSAWEQVVCRTSRSVGPKILCESSCGERDLG